MQGVDQSLEWQLLVLEGVEQSCLHPPDELSEARGALEVNPDRQNVDQAADKTFQLDLGAVRRWDADDQLIVPAPAAEDRRERREQHRERGDARLEAELPYLSHERVGQPPAVHGATMSQDRGTGPVGRQIQDQWRAARYPAQKFWSSWRWVPSRRSRCQAATSSDPTVVGGSRGSWPSAAAV